MKIFNTIQELWDFCYFCPICQDNCREITISVGPDTVFELSSSSKEDNILYMQCEYKNKQNIYTVDYKIDCINNSFDIAITNIQIALPHSDNAHKKVKEAFFYFYIQSICRKCDRSSAHGSDLELDILEKTIYNIGLERESFCFLSNQDEFRLTAIYDRDVMLVSDMKSNKILELPLVKFDFNNQEKIVDKIKTLILFS